jgi:hypothetical protein
MVTDWRCHLNGAVAAAVMTLGTGTRVAGESPSRATEGASRGSPATRHPHPLARPPGRANRMEEETSRGRGWHGRGRRSGAAGTCAAAWNCDAA